MIPKEFSIPAGLRPFQVLFPRFQDLVSSAKVLFCEAYLEWGVQSFHIRFIILYWYPAKNYYLQSCATIC